MGVLVLLAVVACSAAADVDPLGAGAHCVGVVLVVKGHGGPLGGVGIACSAAAGEEARGRRRRLDRGLGGNALGRGGGLGDEEGVACSAAAGVGVGVLLHGWVRLVDGV